MSDFMMYSAAYVGMMAFTAGAFVASYSGSSTIAKLFFIGLFWPVMLPFICGFRVFRSKNMNLQPA